MNPKACRDDEWVWLMEKIGPEYWNSSPPKPPRQEAPRRVEDRNPLLPKPRRQEAATRVEEVEETLKILPQKRPGPPSNGEDQRLRRSVRLKLKGKSIKPPFMSPFLCTDYKQPRNVKTVNPHSEQQFMPKFPNSVAHSEQQFMSKFPKDVVEHIRAVEERARARVRVRAAEDEGYIFSARLKDPRNNKKRESLFNRTSALYCSIKEFMAIFIEDAKEEGANQGNPRSILAELRRDLSAIKADIRKIWTSLDKLQRGGNSAEPIEVSE